MLACIGVALASAGGSRGIPPAIRVDAPNIDVAATLALAHHIDSRPAPPPAGTLFGLVGITPPPYNPQVPHHDPGDEAEMRHLNVEYWPTATAVH